MLQGKVRCATVGDLKEANKLLRFAKAAKDISLKFPKLDTTKGQLGFLALSDAAWATRVDGSSQGGYLVLLVPPEAFNDKKTDYAVLDWRSFKLNRVSRSSMNAESQAAAEAADALEYIKT